MDLISWENISFENIREGDLIRSSTSPASQLNLEKLVGIAKTGYARAL